MRIDKWLWAARFFKTRALASKACELGRIESNGQGAKAAREVRVGGFVAIHISARNGQTYTEQVPVYSAQQRADVFARAGYLQALIGHARAVRG